MFFRINSAFEIMSTKSSEMPDTTEDLVELSNYVTLCRDSTLSKMKAQLRTVGDYIMFLFEYTEFNSNNIPFYFLRFYFTKRININS